MEDLRNEIRDVYMKVGLRDELIVLMISEATVKDESVLVAISEILSSEYTCAPHLALHVRPERFEDPT